MRSLRSVFLVLLALTGSVPVLSQPLDIHDAYVREPIPGRYMSAAFMTLSNTTAQNKTLISASADWAGLIEIHTHLHDNGVMRMRQLESLTIPAGERVSLQPGGLHLMLFKLQLPLSEPLPLTLCFDDGECQTVSAELRSLQ
ncbi:MAG: copper chaperone PCu(A)C [Saccharospirillaceae bacterium]|nr:copper chaperone PCu(A)C [Saccharospirillaceae bacterium]MCD8529783.1 copper chaperone PCu(A)C [Saccharospirillaceae bacterium]